MLSEYAIDYISSILDNLLANEQKSIDFIVDKHYFDVFQNIVYILVVSKVPSEKFVSKIPTIFLNFELSMVSKLTFILLIPLSFKSFAFLSKKKPALLIVPD